MRRAFWVALVALPSCSGPTTRSTSAKGSVPTGTDSVVLERTRCFGTCPAYRLRVSSAGEVRFVSHYPGGATAADTGAVWVTDSLTSEANHFGFFGLPDTITPGAPLCRTNVATDHPTITIGIFGRRTKRVIYYTGCYLPRDHPMASPLRGMQQLASRIDTLTGAGRWIRPVMRR